MKTRILYFCFAALFAAAFLSFSPPSSFKKILKLYPYIPTGLVHQGDQTVSMKGFHIFQHEVTNLEYREFLAHLEQQGRLEDLEVAKIHVEGWDIPSFREFYHTYPAYENYPVVNVSHEGALLYCQWLEGIYREKYGQKVHLRLPSQLEWSYAARPDDASPYPWGGPYLRNSKGCLLANFKNVGPEQIGFDTASGQLKVVQENAESAFGPAPSESYFPNKYGLYNTSGNVAEMLQEKGLAAGGCWDSPGYDIRVESISTYDGPSQYVGFRPVLIFEEEQ